MNIMKQIQAEEARMKREYCAKAMLDGSYHSKYFDSTGYYGNEEHLKMLSSFGINSIDEYQEAVENSPEYKAHDKFDLLFSTCGKNNKELIKEGLKAAGSWHENTTWIDGPELLAVAEAAAPQYAAVLNQLEAMGATLSKGFRGELKVSFEK